MAMNPKSLPFILCSLFLLLIAQNCHTIEKSSIKAIFEEKEKEQFFYTIYRPMIDNKIFETYTVLTILKMVYENSTFLAEEKSFYFITYQQKFLNQVKQFFPRSTMKRFKLITQMRNGMVLTANNEMGIEIEFNQITENEVQSSSLKELIFLHQKSVFPIGKNINEKYLYIHNQDNQIWQSISSELAPSGHMLIWKNRKGLSADGHGPSTKFSPVIEKEYNSSDYNYNSLLLKKLQIDKNTVIATLAFRDTDFSAYYCLNQRNGTVVYTNLEKKRRLNPFKVLNPFIITKRHGH